MLKTICEQSSKPSSEEKALEVKVENLSFPLPFDWKARNVQFFENNELLLEVGEMAVSIPLWELLGKKISFNSIDLADVHLYEIPSYLKNRTSSSSEQQALWKDIGYKHSSHVRNPYSKSCDRTPFLLPTIPPHLFPLEVQGSLIINPRKQTTVVDVALKKQSEQTQPVTRINLAWQGTQQPTFHLNLLENTQGPLSETLGLSIPFDLKLRVEGKISQEFDEGVPKGQFSIHLLKENEIAINDKQIRGTFSYSSNQLLSLQSIEGDIGPACLSGELTFDTNTLAIHQNAFKVKILDCEKVNHPYFFPLKGSLEGLAQATGTLTNPNVELNFTGNHFQVNDLPLNQFNGKFTSSAFPQGYKGYSSLNFNYLNTPFESQAQLEWSGKLLSLLNFKARYGDANLDGHLDYFIEHQILQGSLSGNLEDSTFLQTISAMDFSGSSAWDIKFHGTKSPADEWEQDIDFAINAERARYENLRVQKMQLYGTLKNIFKKSGAFIYLTGEHAHYNGWKVGQLKAETALETGKEALAVSHHNTRSDGPRNFWRSKWHMVYRYRSIQAESPTL